MRTKHDAGQNMVDYSIVQSWEATSVRVCVCGATGTVCHQLIPVLHLTHLTNPVEEFASFQLTLACHPLPWAFVSSASGIQTQPRAAEETYSLIRKCYMLIVSWFIFPR